MSTDNIINTQIQYKLIEEIQFLKKIIGDQENKLNLSEVEKENDKLKEKVKKKSMELKIRNYDLKSERQEKQDIEKALVSLHKSFQNFSNNHDENIKKLLSYIKSMCGSSSVNYLKSLELHNQKSEILYKIGHEIIESAREDYVKIEDFKKSNIYQENSKLFSRNISCVLIYKIPKGKIGDSLLLITFDRKPNNNVNFELILSLISQFILIEEDRKNTHDYVISLYKEVALLNRRISVVARHCESKKKSQSDVEKDLLKLLSGFSNSLISFIYAKDQDKFTRITQSCSAKLVPEIEENLILKLQMLRITQTSKKRFHIKFKKEDLKDEIIAQYKISSATSIPIFRDDKHLGNLVLLHQDKSSPSSADLEYYNIVCLAIANYL